MPTKKAAKAKPEAETEPQLVVDGTVVEFDREDLTLGEAVEAEEFFGLIFDEIPWGSAKGVLFQTYLARKQENPNATLGELMGIKLNVIDIKEGPKRPTEADPETSGDQS
jgi:hypothetical protein